MSSRKRSTGCLCKCTHVWSPLQAQTVYPSPMPTPQVHVMPFKSNALPASVGVQPHMPNTQMGSWRSIP